MANYFDRVRATMELMLTINPDVVSLEDVGQIACMVRDMTDEAKELFDRWWEDQPTDKPDSVAAIG